MRSAKRRAMGALPDHSAAEERAARIAESLERAAADGACIWPDEDAWRPKAQFDVYYRLQQVVPRSEWREFGESLQKPLPVTFRYTASADDAYRAEGERYLAAWEAKGWGTRRLGVVRGWQLHMDKHELRAASAGSEQAEVREWLIRGTDSGKLIRQEVASMLPACLVDVQPGEKVLDMCAAPGSKTTQLLEMLHKPGASTKDFEDIGGLVVANDLDSIRGHTLVKRTASLGLRAAALVVTQHRAQFMPRWPTASPTGGFDKIVCDVPCTGDGTTRKHPEVFKRWEVAHALRQHSVQLNIALRGVALLRVGGTMCFSTCSLNPIENEAVVAEVLRRCGGAVELVDGASRVADELTCGSSPGMTWWGVHDFRLVKHDSLADLRAAADVGKGESVLYQESMWPPDDAKLRAQLTKCVRLLPHKSDTGGFFSALLRKKRLLPLEAKQPSASSTKADAPFGDADSGGCKTNARGMKDLSPYSLVSEEVHRELGVTQAMRNRIFARSTLAPCVVCINCVAEECIRPGSRMNVVHAGVTIAKRRRLKKPPRIGTGRHTLGRYRLTEIGKQILQPKT